MTNTPTTDEKLKDAFSVSSSAANSAAQKFEYVYMTANETIPAGNGHPKNIEMLYRAKYYSPRVDEHMPPAGFCKFNPQTTSFEREQDRVNFSTENMTVVSEDEALQKAASLVKRFGGSKAPAPNKG